MNLQSLVRGCMILVAVNSSACSKDDGKTPRTSAGSGAAAATASVATPATGSAATTSAVALNTAATSVVTVTIDQLTAFHGSCATMNHLSSIPCNAAIDQYCQSVGYVSGFGPTDFSGNHVNITCVAAADAVYESNQSLASLASTYHQPACSQNNPYSLECLSVINQFCQAAGYAGGWGPVEQLADKANFFCTKTGSSAGSVVVTQYFDGLRLYDNPYCDTPANPLSASCLSAVHHACRDLGYLAGYGPVGYNGPHDYDGAVCMGQHLGPNGGKARPFLAQVVPTMASYNAVSSQVRMTYSQSMTTDAPGAPGASQVYTRPFGSLTFSRAAIGSNFALTSAQINLATGAVTSVTKIFTPSAGGTAVGAPTDPVGSLVTAYDPSALFYNGQMWVAFECAGSITNFSFSSCMGLYDTVNNVIAPSSIYVLVAGTVTPTPQTFSGVTVNTTYSASVPKLLHHQGHVYLYWSALTIGPATGSVFNFLTVQGRGIELKQNPNDHGRLEPVDANGSFLPRPLHAVDPQTVQVFTPPDPRGAADISDVVSDGQNLFAVASIGAVGGCTSPYDTASTTVPPLSNTPISGANWPLQCYDVGVSTAQSGPLTQGTFNRYNIIVPESAGYVRFFAQPYESGAKDLLGLIGNFSWEPAPGPSELANMKSQNSLIPIPICSTAQPGNC